MICSYDETTEIYTELKYHIPLLLHKLSFFLASYCRILHIFNQLILKKINYNLTIYMEVSIVKNKS